MNKEEFKTRFPLVHAFMRSGKVNLDHSFLGDKFHRSPEYKFWSHLERFFEMVPELGCIDETMRRLTIESPMDDAFKLSWEKKRLFRSAQSEISACFVFDHIFNIKILRLIEETQSRKQPDFIVQIGHVEHPVEVKSHTGNINNNVVLEKLKCHARSYKGHSFDPKDASDLIRWLVDENSASSRDGKPKIPMFIEAENKGAHILFAHFEIMPFGDPISIISSLDGRTAAVDTFRSGNSLVRHGRWERLGQLKHLSEIVLWNECAADEFFLFTNGQGSLLKHLRSS